MVNIGKLNKRVAFLAAKNEIDSMKQDRLVYYKLASVWATVKPFKSSDANLSGKKSPEVSHKIYIRYRTDITPDMRIEYGGKHFKMIGYPIDLDEKHELLEIQAEMIL